MKKMVNLLSLFLICKLLCPNEAAGQLSSQPVAQDVNVSFTLDSQQLSISEPVVGNLTIRNNSNRSFKIDLGKDREESFHFTVTRPDGMKMSVPPRRRGGLGRIGMVSVGPGQEYQQKLLLNEWVSFDMMGSYEIKIALAAPSLIEAGSRSGDDVPAEFSFQAILYVSSRNPERLRETCELLTKQAESASSYEEASQAALTLSYVRDPIAVPYLDRVLHANPLVDVLAINGLEAIANKEAIEVIISALSIHDPPQTSKIASARLEIIAGRTTDQSIKNLIKQALSQEENKR